MSHTTFDVVKAATVRVTKVDPDRVQLDSHIVDDLGIESLDFVDIMMEVEDKLGIEIPLPKFQDAGERDELTVRAICGGIDKLRADKK